MWMVTYGDMMSLLLCFFIMLAAFSEIKKPREFQKVVEAFKEAFGYEGGAGKAPTETNPMLSLIERLVQISEQHMIFKEIARNDDPGVHGNNTTVQRVREGFQFTIGGLITFEPGSAELKPQAREHLIAIANEIRGYNNKLEVRGHATGMDAVSGSSFDDLYDLSYARAAAARDFLTSPEVGLRSRRIRLMACSDTEPLVGRNYDPMTQGVNRRVEMIVKEALVQDFEAVETAAVPTVSLAEPE